MYANAAVRHGIFDISAAGGSDTNPKLVYLGSIWPEKQKVPFAEQVHNGISFNPRSATSTLDSSEFEKFATKNLMRFHSI